MPLAKITRFATRSDGRRATLESGLAVGTRLVGTAATFVYTILLARVMSPHDVGVVWTIWSGTFIAAILATLNIGSGAVREIVRARTQDQPDIAAGFVVASRMTLAIFAPIVVAGFLGFSYLASPSSFFQYFWAYMLAAISIPLMGWVQTNASHAAALEQALRSQIPRTLLRPLIFVIAFIVIYLAAFRPSVEFTIGLYLSATSAAAVVQFVLLRPAFRFMKGVRPNKDAWRDWIKSGLSLSPMILLTDQLKNVIVLFASLALAPAAVSQVAIALSIINFLNFGISAVDVQFGPRLAKALFKENSQQLKRLLAVSNAIKFGPCLVGAAAIMLGAEYVLSLFGRHYVGGDGVSRWLLLIPLSKAFFGNTTLLMQIKGYRREIFWSSIVGTAAMGCGIYFGGRLIGLEAAAALAGSAFAALQLFRYVVCRVATGVDPSVMGSIGYYLSRRRARDERPAERNVDAAE